MLLPVFYLISFYDDMVVSLATQLSHYNKLQTCCTMYNKLTVMFCLATGKLGTADMQPTEESY